MEGHMGEQFQSIDAPYQKFIEAQHIFFVGTAAADGKVNVSPKGMDSLRVMGPNRVVWRNMTGSGNETAGHLAQVNRMTLMWCGFERQPMIYRAYGTARTIHPRDADWDDLNGMFEEAYEARQIYDMTVEMTQKSCGFAVPFYEHAGERDTLKKWAENKGPDGVQDYWRDRNQKTLDGAPSGVIG